MRNNKFSVGFTIIKYILIWCLCLFSAVSCNEKKAEDEPGIPPSEIIDPELPDFIPGDIADMEGMAVKGYIYEQKKGIRGVVVTDGFSVSVTDENGIYYLPFNSKAEFVYISSPSGYNLNYKEGLASFYKKIEKRESVFRADFYLEKTETDDTNHKFIVEADPQIYGPSNLKRYEAEALPEIKGRIDAMREEGLPVHVMVLGDIVFNTPEMFDSYVESLKNMNVPFYHVPGNHDKDINLSASSTSIFKSYFGPLYYSFNRGKIHYLMFDNVFCKGADSYEGRLSDDMLAWLQKDLSYIPKGSTVVIGMHIPTSDGATQLRINASLHNILGDYKTYILSGHAHSGKHIVINSNIEEKVHSTLCGAFWYDDYALDGTPNGYYVYDVKGSEISWQYKATGLKPEEQMHVYHPVSSESGKDVVVNVYNYDTNWKVSWFLDDEYMGSMVYSEMKDPTAVNLYSSHPKTWVRPVVSKHIFKATPPVKGKKFEVHVTDRFGNKYKKAIAL